MGDKAGGTVTVGYHYYMSIHMGIGRGPIDELKTIKVGDLVAWNGSATDTSVFSINSPNLFGGDKKEGGIQGSLTLLMGKPNQNPGSWIRNLMGGRVPGFRGVVTMFFDGMICALNPYPKSWKMRVRRTVTGWDNDEVWQPSLAAIWLAGGQIKAMNPAHIIYECVTNRVWGRGHPKHFINEAAWLEAAQTLYNENFGMCIRWNRQDSLQAFIQNIVDCIGGSLFVDRLTGLLTLKLIRGDYDINELPLFDYDSGLIELVEGDTVARNTNVNEIIVNWVDPIKGKERQVRVHNLAAIQATGAPISQTTDYKGLPTLELASRCGQRDLKVTSSALKKFKLKLNRRAWRIYPGAVFRVSAPDKGIQNVVLRAGKVTDGQLTNGVITVEAVIDVFGLPASTFVAQETSSWVPPDRSTQVITTRYVREVTYRDLVKTLSAPEMNLVTDAQGAISVMASKPTPLSFSYLVMAHADGEDYPEGGRTGSFCPSASLAAPLSIYATTIAYSGGIDMGLVKVGRAVQIGEEIVRLDAVTPVDDGASGTITIARGCVDTIPGSHPTGTRIFFFDNYLGSDFRDYVAGENVSIKLLTTTSSNVLPIDTALEDTLEIFERQALPLPPGDLRVNGTPFGSIGSVTGDVTFTWAHRDRKIQQDQLIEHGVASVGPETGVTYTVHIFATLGSTVPVRTVEGLSDPTWLYTDEMISDDGRDDGFVFELASVRDGRASFQKYKFAVNHSFSSGYGSLYGYTYGE